MKKKKRKEIKSKRYKKNKRKEMKNKIREM